MLGCADPRVSPELLFDQGIGDIFTVRVAGNIVDVVVDQQIDPVGAHQTVRVAMVGAAEVVRYATYSTTGSYTSIWRLRTSVR